MSVQIQIVHTGALDARVRDEILTLCREAYQEDLDGYLENIGPGVHLLGRVENTARVARDVRRTLAAAAGWSASPHCLR